MTESTDKRDVGTPSGGWGSLKAVTGILLKESAVLPGVQALKHQNQPDGFACVSCSWAKPADPSTFEFCENGAKATAWELTSRRVRPDFFDQHTVAELLTWEDYDLENAGRLTTPMRWDSATDRYVRVSWEAAFEDIGRRLKRLDPDGVIFYASGRASLETSYMYQLFARLYGTNNLPDSSNMCHESTAVGLKASIGVGVGTVQLEDFKHTDCFFFFGQNVGTNSPRMLHPLQEARRRGAEIITFNPIREPGLVSFTNPQSPVEMITHSETAISTQYHQVKIGGDIAAITGMCKAIVAADDAARSSGQPAVIDHAFIAEHTHGFDDFIAFVRAAQWPEIESESGLSRAAIEAGAGVYCRAKAVMGVYGMGLTQHRRGVENVQMVVNLLLLRGNIGRPGAGVCPVRGHSNVQGQRTVGITEKPELAPLDKLAEQYRFEPPRHAGRNTVEACEGILDGSVKAFISLGGNFVRAAPETALLEEAWRELELTVQIATKLNRSHVVHGKASYVLPCLGRIEVDRQASGEQAVAMEDSTGCMHGSRGRATPAADTLLSEPAIVAALARATLPEGDDRVPWGAWVDDYSRVRDAIAETLPEIFHDFNARMWIPGGFHRPLGACQREWATPTKRANFIFPPNMNENPDVTFEGAQVMRLMTMRSDDQFNTTVYGYDDRFRGVKGTRRVLLINADDMARLGFEEGARVDVRTVCDDDVDRSVSDFTLQSFNLPAGCLAGYYPECNPLVPLFHHAKESKVPGYKSIPVRLSRAQASATV
jgi:molybdopterin-dependent oxidoreductase alpha subunit